MSRIDPTAYPFANPGKDFLYFRGKVLDLSPESWPRWAEGRTAVLAYGSNASPEQLRRKFGDLRGEVEIPTFRAVVPDRDVVYAALLARYGSVPATIVRCPAAALETYLQFLSPRELERMDETEGLGTAYAFEPGFTARLSGGSVAAFAYVALRGPLRLAGSPVGLSEVPAPGSTLRRLRQAEVLEKVRALNAPELGFEEFLRRIVGDDEYRERVSFALRGGPPRDPRLASAPEAGSPFRSEE